MKKRWMSVVLLAGMAVSLIACGGTESNESNKESGNESSNETEKQEDITIAVVAKSLDNYIFNDAKVAALEKGEELGINVEWNGPVSPNVTEQVSIIETYIERGVDGILIGVNTADSVLDVIERAKAAGIYVGTFDSDSPDSERDFFVGSDNYQFGYVAGEEMAKMMPDGGEIAILTGQVGSDNLEQRIDGFEDATKDKGITSRTILACEDSVTTGIEVTEQYIGANPDLDGYFSVGGWPIMGDSDALPTTKQWAQDGGVFVCIDCVYTSIPFLLDGTTKEQIGQDFITMGATGVETLYKLIKNEDAGIPDDGLVMIDPVLVKEENAEEYQSTLQAY